MKKTSGSIGAIIILISIIVAGFHYIGVWTAKEAGLGDINYSIGFALFTLIMFLLGAMLIIQGHLVDLTNSQGTKSYKKDDKSPDKLHPSPDTNKESRKWWKNSSPIK